MQNQSQSRWFVSALAGLLIFLTLLSGYFLLPERLARHFLERLSQESGIEILPVRVDYSLLSGELILKDSDLYLVPGLQISADEVRMRIPLSTLSSSDALQLSGLYFQSPFINVDLDRLGSSVSTASSPLQKYMTTVVKSFELGKGGLFLSRTGTQPLAASLAYQSIQIQTSNSGELKLSIDGLSEKGDWAFQGQFDLGARELNGELDVRNVPLDTIQGAFPDSSFEHWEQATVSANQSVFWSPRQSVSMEGTLILRQGLMSFAEDQKIRWDELELLGFSLSDGSVSVVKGSLNDADALLSEQALALLPEQLKAFSELELRRLNLFSQPAQWQSDHGKAELSNLNGQLVRISEQALTLKGAAYALQTLPVVVDAELHSDGQGKARINLREVDLGTVSKQKRVVAGYDLAGSKMGTVMQLSWGAGERHAKGRLTFTRFTARPDNGSATDWNLPLIRAVMTDNKGRIVVPVAAHKLPEKNLSSALINLLQNSVKVSLKRVTDKPLLYLGQLSGSQTPLVEKIDYQPGKALLCNESEQTVRQWTSVLNRRPALALSFQGFASRTADRAGLARAELDVDLLELYSTLLKEKPENVAGIPLETREQLIEQMYLRIHNRRLPEVGELSQQQRVVRAENWLVSHWPVKPESFQKLAEGREQTIRNCLLEAGVDSKRLHIEPAQVVDGQARMRFEFIY
ncbi:DUF748 domain-containing protein [Endozoicomonas euniceicola]|uniref:DUF748 domain-containing protein n=1 Tax=Endozoicomonas euniceicola TaxID=1234143 RepID=A0ABY6GY16_9GAMM|nr:hypothetical protein [Endozoicomonas euniceicola]UYM16834.1 hypothetical protein NX720_02595 [Endozoicomonas euniceicola]